MQELQSIIGLLSFACRAIESGRCFLRRLIHLTIGVSRPQPHIRITREARRDIRAWLLFLEGFSGTLYFRHPKWSSSPAIRLFTDTSDLGFGLVYSDRWTCGTWLDLWSSYNINICKMYPLVLALTLYGDMLCNHHILFMTDNSTVAYCVNKQTSTDAIIMQLICQLVVSAMTDNVVISACWLASRSNQVADLLSRLSIPQARTAPWLRPEPTSIPPSVLPWTRP